MQTKPETATERLYESDGHLKTFDATVLRCTPDKPGRYAVVLDRTAFFPEGGGQAADTGTIGSARVSDVQEQDGDVLHFTDAPVEAGATVSCAIDYEQRFARMQSHTGEHIVSGLIYRLFGFHNVGFHLGSEDVTLDLDGELTREDLDRVERLANVAVSENLPVACSYPSAEELEKLDYRSKLALTGNVRIVTIPGYDCCACCAPHVSHTGEIGLIKLLDFLRYKGGTRIHMLAGFAALDDYRKKYANASQISMTLSVKPNEIADGVHRMADELLAAKRALGECKKELLRLRGAAMPYADGNLCFFETESDPLFLRELANLGAAHTGGVCAVFSGTDGAYRYVAASRTADLRAFAKTLNAAFAGRGGGTSEMIQGSVSATRAALESFFGASSAT